MSIFKRLSPPYRIFPPYCPPGSSYDSFNEKGDRICKKDGDDENSYRFIKDTDCNLTVDKMGNYELQLENAQDDCDRKKFADIANEALPSGLTGKRLKRKKSAKGLSNCPDKQKYYPNSKRTCKKRKMVWRSKSKRCTLKKR